MSIFACQNEYHSMKKIFSIIIIIGMVAIVFSCSKEEEPCEAIIENSGIIHKSVDISSCEEPFYQGNFVINNNVEYDSVLALNNSCDRPFIDFSSYTLLGRYAYTSNTGSYYRKVVADTVNSSYNYTITVTNCGSCNCLSQNMNWVLVPKLPYTWSVKFIVN